MNDLFSMANFHLDDVKSSYFSIDYHSEMSKINTTNHLLEFLTYYDQQTNKNKDILRMVRSINDPGYNYFSNAWQRFF